MTRPDWIVDVGTAVLGTTGGVVRAVAVGAGNGMVETGAPVVAAHADATSTTTERVNRRTRDPFPTRSRDCLTSATRSSGGDGVLDRADRPLSGRGDRRQRCRIAGAPALVTRSAADGDADRAPARARRRRVDPCVSSGREHAFAQ